MDYCFYNTNSFEFEVSWGGWHKHTYTAAALYWWYWSTGSSSSSSVNTNTIDNIVLDSMAADTLQTLCVASLHSELLFILLEQDLVKRQGEVNTVEVN